MRWKVGADGFALGGAQNGLRNRSGGDDDVGTAAYGGAGGEELGAHAPGARGGSGALSGALDVGSDAGDERDELSGRILAGVGRVEAIAIGEENEEIGIDEIGDERRELIVIADANFVDSGDIVLVDNGKNVIIEAVEERGAGVEVTLAVAEILAGEKGLSDWNGERLEGLIPELHKESLADSGEDLFARNVFGVWSDLEAAAASGGGA